METDIKEYGLWLDGVDEGMMDAMIADLATAIKQVDHTVNVTRVRTDPDAQDLGSELLLILASPAVVPVVKAIIDWIKSTHKMKLRLRTPDGTVLEADNITERGLLKLAEAYRISAG